MYAFKELYDNAITAMSDGGKLKISSSVINNRKLQITIEDNGTGIAPDCLTKIFDRGFKNRPGGTGLGLYIVKRNIELHRGEIVVENNENSGATFYVTLPIEK